MVSQDLSSDSQRRQATVLFADISGFTNMSERMDPEDVTAVMNRCFAMLERVIMAHGGHVDKYIGDCIMATFGVPAALEDAPKQAVNAAIEIRNSLHEFDNQQPAATRLAVHIGVNSGLVIAGNVGGQVKHDFTVMGETVNLASRLKDASANGQIYVGADTYQYTKGEFEYRQLKPLSLKGMRDPVVAYELLSAKEKIYRPKVGSAARMIFSEFVGRQVELTQLRRCIVELLAGTGGIVSIVGEAGIGKSRLTAEAELLPEAQDTMMLEGRSLSVGQGLSFHPFDDLLRHWAAITDDDDEAAALAKLEAAMARTAGVDVGETLPFVATLMGMRLGGAYGGRIHGIEGEAMERLILKTMRQLLERIAASKPLILIFEDLHWADASSIKLLEALLRLVDTAPILFLLVFRPDFPHTSERIRQCARERFAERSVAIELDPLDEQQSDLLIRGLLKIDDLPDATRALISQRAEGNPFYIEEVVRSLIDEGAVEAKEGRLLVTEKIHSIVVPGTLQEVIMARVDRLDERARRLLQVAAVIGRSFYYRVIADVLGAPPALDDTLAYLKERQLIHERTSRRTAARRRRTVQEEVEYVFKHALLQETIYESILQRTRKELHLQVARSIEAVFGDRLIDFYGMLAYHYSRAENLEKAEEYLFKAGDEAARSAASSEALAYFREAWRFYILIHGDGGDPNKKAMLEKNIGLALLNTGDLTECTRHFDRALAYLGERVPASRFGVRAAFLRNLLAVLFRLYVPVRTRRATGAAAVREVLEVMYWRARAQTTTDPERFFFDSIASIRRLNQLDPSTVEGAAGKYAGASALFSFSGFSFAISRAFLDVARPLIQEGNLADVFPYRVFRFVHNYFAGNWREPPEIDDGLVEQALRYGQLWDVDSFLGLDGEKQLDMGDFAAAQRRLGQISEITDAYGYEFARSNQLALHAFIPLAQRRLPEALAAVESYHRERHEKLLNLIALGTKAKIQTLLCEYEAAEETLHQADALTARIGIVPPFHAGAYRLSRQLLDVRQLEAALTRGDRVMAQAYRKRARVSSRRARATARKMARLRTEAYRTTGTCQWLLGNARAAGRWWRRSLQEGERLGAKLEVARTCAEVGTRMLQSGGRLTTLNGTVATTYMERARALFDELELTWDLEQLERVTRRADRERTTAAA
jgi:class 3 adenylate cyclase/tetratricopeptide (TPR) repeat protein